MDYASDPVGRLKPAHSSPALLAMLGAVAVTAGLPGTQKCIRKERECLAERCGNDDVTMKTAEFLRRADVGGRP